MRAQVLISSANGGTVHLHIGERRFAFPDTPAHWDALWAGLDKLLSAEPGGSDGVADE